MSEEGQQAPDTRRILSQRRFEFRYNNNQMELPTSFLRDNIFTPGYDT